MLVDVGRVRHEGKVRRGVRRVEAVSGTLNCLPWEAFNSRRMVSRIFPLVVVRLRMQTSSAESASLRKREPLNTSRGWPK